MITIITTTALIEAKTIPGAYDLGRTLLIVEHPQHGRLLLAEEYGGEQSLCGGQYRWGSAYRLRADDTFRALAADWNEATTVLQAVEHGADDSRPPLDWSPVVVAAMAQTAQRNA